jgi:hypothetical protein
MSDACNLIRWIITYAVSGGFWHFVAVYLICAVLVRTLGLVRVNIERKTASDNKEAA